MQDGEEGMEINVYGSNPPQIDCDENRGGGGAVYLANPRNGEEGSDDHVVVLVVSP
jgi:hypothetical protein